MEKKYFVLARKYRPLSFKDLKGQDTMVKFFESSFANNRLAHSYLFTGIRGVGKTTTARIIAKSLNCIGNEGDIKSPTIDICGKCIHCTQITEDRHPDILEIDGASKTGIEDIQDIIDFTRYAPISARYKVIIIDEVHMISIKAFNALLKTLEEPPAHVIFIFATTELRKIPITILSRCQKFELRRLSTEEIKEHLSNICDREKIEFEENALMMIASSSEGSVRDSLSLLDQAINHSYTDKRYYITEQVVQELIGRTSNKFMLEFLNEILTGNVEKVFEKIKECALKGGEPVSLIESLLELTHFITLRKNDLNSENAVYLNEDEKAFANNLTERLSMPVITRLWNMLLKGLEEVRNSPHEYMALEMVMARLCFVTHYPTPIDLLNNSEPLTLNGNNNIKSTISAKSETVSSAVQRTNIIQAKKEFSSNPTSYIEILDLLASQKNYDLLNNLRFYGSLVKFDTNYIEINLSKFEEANPDEKLIIHLQLRKFLKDHTGVDWEVIKSESLGDKPIDEQEQINLMQQIEHAKTNKNIKSLLDNLSGAEIVSVSTEETIQ
ncbi:MAG: DNA polymerase III subunit gamma/tau [Sphingobacteriia bacterium]|nr:DNA polymerase III subunit gamma/tau [Sphingobacteriia bacterium]